MAIANALTVAQVTHKRTAPKSNHFRYGIYSLCFPLSRLSDLGASRLLSVNARNLFSFYPRDYGDESGNIEGWIRNLLAQWGLQDAASGEIVLLSMPRLFGYAFNPVSFWFCLDKQHRVRAVVSEVHNTFGERHCYISYHDDARPISPKDWLISRKVFHVSPFMEVQGTYRYRFILKETRVAVWIHYANETGSDQLYTSLTGKRMPLTTGNLLACFFRYPMVTFKATAMIHWQALKLFAKGIRYRRKPIPPTTEVTR